MTTRSGDFPRRRQRGREGDEERLQQVRAGAEHGAIRTGGTTKTRYKQGVGPTTRAAGLKALLFKVSGAWESPVLGGGSTPAEGETKREHKDERRAAPRSAFGGPRTHAARAYHGGTKGRVTRRYRRTVGNRSLRGLCVFRGVVWLGDNGSHRGRPRRHSEAAIARRMGNKWHQTLRWSICCGGATLLKTAADG